jgi:hypothetical protein
MSPNNSNPESDTKAGCFMGRHRTAGIVAWLTLAAAVAGMIGIVVFGGLMVNPDSAAYLQCASLILKGNIPYVDFVEINPPLIYYINILPVFLAHILSGNESLIFHVMIVMLAIFSTTALGVLLYRFSRDRSIPSYVFTLAAWIGFSIFTMTIGGFGQREHMFMLAYAPWLYCREARYRGKTVSTSFALLLGLIAGPFILLKPHFCVMVIILEAWMLYRNRRVSVLWAPEFIAFAAWGLVYAGHFAVIPSAMRQAFFFRVVPFVTANYNVYDCPAKRLLLCGLPPFGLLVPVLLLIALSALAINNRISMERRQQVGMLTLGCLLGLGIFAVQHKGWPYHLFPAIGMADLLISTLLVEALSRSPKRCSFFSDLREQCFSVLCIVLLVAISTMTLRALSVSKTQNASVGKFVRLIQSQSKPGDRITFIDTAWMWTYPALVCSNRLTGAKYMPTFPIAFLNKNARLSVRGTFPYKSENELGDKERTFLNDLGAVLLVHRPSLVFINDAAGCTGCPPKFCIDKYLQKAGWYDRYLKDYKQFTTIENFVVYKRK